MGQPERHPQRVVLEGMPEIQPGDLPRAFRLPPGQWVAVAASHTTDGAPEPGWAPDQAASVNLPARSLILMLDKLT